MMRKLATGIGAAVCALLCFSCQPVQPGELPEDVSGGAVVVDLKTVDAPEEGTSVVVNVSAPQGASVTTRVETTAKDWLSVNPLDGTQYEIKVEMNDATKARSAKLFFSATGCASATVTVSQAGAADVKHLNVSQTDFSFTHKGGDGSFTVDAYPEPSVEVVEGAEWISGVELKDGECSFSVAEWVTEEFGVVRTGKIKLSAIKSEDVIVTVAQSSSEFVRRSLVTKFTGTWCGYCPFMSFAIEGAIETFGDAIVPLYIYSGSDSLDSDGTLATTLKVTGLPSGIVDYRAFFSNYNEVSDTQAQLEALVQETLDSYPSASGFKGKTSISGGKLNIEVSVLSTVTEPDMKLAVVVMENGLVAKQEFYGTASDYPEIDFKNYVHDHVARVWPSGSLGESLPVEAGKPVTKTYSVDLGSGWVAGNLEVAFFTIRPFPSEYVKGVSGAKYTDKAGGYVDNVVCVKAGESFEYDSIK